jgi:hypothetical protein
MILRLALMPRPLGRIVGKSETELGGFYQFTSFRDAGKPPKASDYFAEYIKPTDSKLAASVAVKFLRSFSVNKRKRGIKGYRLVKLRAGGIRKPAGPSPRTPVRIAPKSDCRQQSRCIF